MTTFSSGTHARDGKRAAIPAATEAALWALSNGRCYAPGCTQPVVVEVSPGIYKKNAQVAHIYGVKKDAPRYREHFPERDSFQYLLLLCLPHHGLVDDKKTGERMYPPETLLEWKKSHEGNNARALATLGSITEEELGELLIAVFTPPVERLEAIAEQLERTGTVTIQNLADLKAVIAALQETPTGIDASTARSLAYAAEVFSTHDFTRTAQGLAYAAEALPGSLRRLESAARTITQFS